MNFRVLVHRGAGSNKRRIRKKEAYNEQEEETVKIIKQAACSFFHLHLIYYCY